MSEEKKQTIKGELATFQQRLVAAIIDYVILILALGVLNLVAFLLGLVSYWLGMIMYGVLNLVALAAGIFYYAYWPTMRNGQTIGKKQQGIAVAIIEDPEKMVKIRPVEKGDFMPMLLRWLLMIVDGILFGVLAYIFISGSPNRQRLGDQIAKTVVIVAPEEAPAPKK